MKKNIILGLVILLVFVMLFNIAVSIYSIIKIDMPQIESYEKAKSTMALNVPAVQEILAKLRQEIIIGILPNILLIVTSFSILLFLFFSKTIYSTLLTIFLSLGEKKYAFASKQKEQKALKKNNKILKMKAKIEKLESDK